MFKEKIKRRIRRITAFAAAMAMAVTITVPGEIFGSLDLGLTASAAGTEQQSTDEASVTINGETLYYATLEEAFSAADGKTATITMLNDAECTVTSGSPIDVMNKSNITLNMNGKTLSGHGTGDCGIITLATGSLSVQGPGTMKSTFKCLSCQSKNAKMTVENITFDVSEADYGVWVVSSNTVTLNNIQIIGKAKIAAVYQYSKSANVTINNMNAIDGGYSDVCFKGNTLKINGGTFDKISVNSYYVASITSVSQVLGEGCIYRNNEDKTWVTSDLSNTYEISNVTVEKIPLTMNPEAETSWYYNSAEHSLHMNAEPTTAGNDITYEWYDGDTKLECDSDTYTIPKTMPAGSYTYTCKATCDGYILSHEFTYTIEKVDPVVTVDTEQNVMCGVGTFTEPVVNDVDGNTLAGTLTYDGESYENTVESLNTKTNGSTGSIGYTFTPDDTTNYKNATGTINYTMVDVAFKVGDADATAENAVTVKANPTYGDAWAEILTLNTGLKAVLLDETVTTGFSIEISDVEDTSVKPNAENYTYKVLFNGTIGGKRFTNHVVATGTVDVGKKEIDEIVITDITAPAAKETLDTSASTSAANYTLGAVSWTDGDTSVTEAGFDKAYTATVVVTAEANHTFGSSLTAKVNGETASVTKNADGTVTVTYTFEKTAVAAVTKIEMGTLPTKTEYFVGEDIDLTGAKITVTYEDGSTPNIDVTSEMISGFDSSTAGTNTVTVTYEGKTTTFNVTIKEPAVTGITISTTPTKTEYLIGDSLDVTGGKITVSYEYGADKVIPITLAIVTGFDSSAAVSSQTLTVTYEEKTDTYTITVKKHTPTVTAPTASAITLGQTLAASTLSDNTWSWEDSSIQPTSAGTHSYTAVKTVSDADKYDYTALDGFTFSSSTNTLTTNVSIEVKRAAASVTPPTASNTLTYGQPLSSAAGLTEGWTWENASTIPDVNNTGFTAYKIVTDYDNFDYSNLTGFDYDETTHKLSCTVSVTVSPASPTDATTASQSFTSGTASTAFAALVFKGIDGAELTGSVSYTYGGQTYATTAALTAALDLLDGGATGTISYTFTPNSANYTTANGSISFEVIDAVVTGITLKSAPTKTTYEVGDTIDLTGGKITVSYNNGTSADIDITDAMTSGFDSTTAGEKTVIVTYGGFTTSFKVTVSKGSFTVEPQPGNIDGAEIDMPEEELYDAVLTPEDKELIENGVDIAVLMTVITINPSSVPANDVTAIDNVMGDFELGCYIDVELFKRYSNGNPDVPVTDTNAPITISFKVSADILTQYPVSEYEYSVFCSHNGVGYPVTCSYNAATNVMSFSSTMFSTYALAVKSTTPAAVDYTITADSHVTVQATAQAGEIVSVTVEDGYKATVKNALGTVITTITGTGSFVMPESNVTITSELINTHVHNYSTEWNMDNTSHWHECACGDKVNIAAHVSNGGIVTVRPTETTEGVRTYSCSICGYVLRTETIPMLDPDHSHSYGAEWKSDSTSHWHECDCGEKVDIAYHISDNGVVTLQPTETSEGIMTYSCSICGYILRTETIPANTPVHTHNYGTAWYYDSTSHWHECSCGDKSNIGQHISNGGIVTVQPTATSTGLRVYSCSICGYVLRTETIPATGYNDYPSYPSYPTYPTYPFDSSIFNVVTFTDKVNVTAETEGNTVTIKWDKVEKADKYYVYQYKNGKYVKVKTTSDTSATFKKLKNGETYKFLIRYTKSGRLSPTKYSGTISVKIYYKPIPKPTATKNSIKLTWDAVPEAEKYAVYKYVDGKAIKLTETKKLSVKIGKLIPDTEYKYIVRAYVDGKWTTMLKSDIVTVKTKAE